MRNIEQASETRKGEKIAVGGVKMKKNKGMLGIILLSAIMAMGCAENNSMQSSKEQSNKTPSVEKQDILETEVMFPEKYTEKVDETLNFQAQVVPPDGLHTKNPEVHVTYKTMDFEIALKELFSDVGEFKREEEMLQPENSLHQSAYDENGAFMSNRQGFFYMEKPNWKKVKNVVELSRKDLAYNAELFKKSQEFGFGTAEDSWNSLKETVERLGVKMELKPSVFYLDYATMEEAARNTVPYDSGEEGDSWSEADNGYYISAVQCMDGNTIYANTYYGKGIEGEADTANILALVNKDGIQMLEMTRIIDQIEETDEYWELLPFEDIIEAVKQRFALIITGDTVQVTEIRFSYMTEAVGDEIYRLVPVWFCNYEKTGKDGITTMQQLIINASTGEEVIYELY